jgi:hypothetical protein
MDFGVLAAFTGIGAAVLIAFMFAMLGGVMGILFQSKGAFNGD